MTPPDDQRERLRFEELDLETFPDGRCVARVRLGWREGVCFEGRSEGTLTLQGELRAGATAAIAALEKASSNRLRLELMGVKAVRAFDNWVVIVALRARSEERSYRLVGAYACPDDVAVRGAAIAVLNATNRVMARYVERS